MKQLLYIKKVKQTQKAQTYLLNTSFFENIFTPKLFNSCIRSALSHKNNK